MEDHLTVCSYCKAFQMPDTLQWIKRGDPTYKALAEKYENNLTHGICEPCLNSEREAIERVRRSRLEK
jgi:hypothetical protein